MSKIFVKNEPICTSMQPCIQVCGDVKNKCHEIRFLNGKEIDKLKNIEGGIFDEYVRIFKKNKKLKKAKTIIAIKNLENSLYGTRNPKKTTKKQKKKIVKYYSSKKKINSNKIYQIIDTFLGKEQIWIDTYTSEACAGNNLIMTLNNDVLCVPYKVENNLYVWSTRAPCIDKHYRKQQIICNEQLSGDRRDYSWKITIPKAPICNDFDKTTLTDVRLSKQSDYKERNLFFQL